MTDGEPVLVPGGRDVRGTLDRADDGDSTVRGDNTTGDDEGTDANICVIACPPHPQHRGHRGDERLRAVSDALCEQGIDCLRFDYGDWDDGYGERADVRNAVGWAADRYETVGLFGFSFGGTLSLLVASDRSDIDAVAALAPTAKIDDELDATAAVPVIDCPTLVVYGTRDDVADWRPVVEVVETAGGETVELAGDHFFVGQSTKVAEAVGSWLGPTLLADDG